MKKYFLLLLIIILMGCSKKDNSNIINDFVNRIEKVKSYKVLGNLEVQNDEEIFKYTIDISYLKDNYYKVEMINVTNNHKQIILRNDDGLYVITPALNKSFKFESTWPDNSSQSYILSSVINDIKKDSNKELSEENGGYVIKTIVNYPNNKDLKYQKIYLDNKLNIKMIEVYGENGIVKIKMEYKDVDLKAGISKDIFDLKNYITDEECTENCEEKKTMSEINSAIYPLYMPSETYLSSSDVVSSDDNSRVILTYSGNKNFVLIEEGAVMSQEHEIIPVYGEPLMLNDTIAALSQNSMYWTSNDIDYYIISDDLSVSEMVFIATSLNNAKATAALK